MSKQIAVIDIGTTGIRILAAKINDTGIPHIIAKSAVSCNAIKKYVIEDVNGLTESIKTALKKIKDQTGIVIKSAYISIPGKHIKFLSNSDSIDIPDDEEEISYKSIGQLLDKTASVEVYENETIIDVMPIKFYINDETSVADPCGMAASRLKVDAKVILGSKEYINQITECLKNAEISVDGFIPLCLAMTELLNEVPGDSKSKILIDIGGQVTEYAVYYKEIPYVLGAFPVGGDHITTDLSQVFKISLNEAESIKKDYPLATLEVLSNNIDVAVFSLETGTQEKLKVADLVEVMQARIENIFEIVKAKLDEDEIESSMIDRVIITGDGITKFKGVSSVCTNILECTLTETDFGRLTGMKSVYTYSSGMLMYIASQLPLGRKQSVFEREFQLEDINTAGNAKKGFFAKISEKIKEVLASFRE